jgi:hypothetical protein
MEYCTAGAVLPFRDPLLASCPDQLHSMNSQVSVIMDITFDVLKGLECQQFTNGSDNIFRNFGHLSSQNPSVSKVCLDSLNRKSLRNTKFICHDAHPSKISATNMSVLSRMAILQHLASYTYRMFFVSFPCSCAVKQR